ncbi:hypothetical protein PR202_ga23307 [Eleusine coracana subsp. coracana]|uniref:Glutaredoxin domain-containing protein n=1 Tax=Eleusine coracana subsp. coracana TaxID=191504 RepID=A0AAV5D5I0_ELECO|nr:hypothetical protein PR202_ga23307 [Eleusine coracana subsp. coracana]
MKRPPPAAAAAGNHRRGLAAARPFQNEKEQSLFAEPLTAGGCHGEEQAASQPAIQQFMSYLSGLGGAPDAFGDSTTSRVAADPDTHQDFQPTSKSSGASLHDIVAQDIKENPVIIYMKGHPDAPRCGFSALAVKVLQQYGVRITSRDILTDLKLKDSVKAHT